MKRSFLASVALVLTLAAATVPATVAADPGSLESSAPADPVPTATPVVTDDRIAPDGEISIDPTFITATPTPAAAGEVKDAAGRPRVTPPPTDSVDAKAASGATLQALMLFAVLGLSLALIAARAPARRLR